jgi:hypothetical protein
MAKQRKFQTKEMKTEKIFGGKKKGERRPFEDCWIAHWSCATDLHA